MQYCVDIIPHEFNANNKKRATRQQFLCHPLELRTKFWAKFSLPFAIRSGERTGLHRIGSFYGQTWLRFGSAATRMRREESTSEQKVRRSRDSRVQSIRVVEPKRSIKANQYPIVCYFISIQFSCNQAGNCKALHSLATLLYLPFQARYFQVYVEAIRNIVEEKYEDNENENEKKIEIEIERLAHNMKQKIGPFRSLVSNGYTTSRN